MNPVIKTKGVLDLQSGEKSNNVGPEYQSELMVMMKSGVWSAYD